MKNIVFKTFLLLAFISLSACGKNMTVNAGGAGGDHSTGQNPPIIPRDQTNMKLCSGAPPKNASIMGETWLLTQSTGNSTHVLGLYVENNQTTLSITCTALGLAAQTASVKASSTFDGATLKHAAASTSGSQRTGCTTYMDGNPSSYKLMGSCLLINLNGSNHYFVRASKVFLNF